MNPLHWSSERLRSFQIGNIFPDDIEHMHLRLILLNTKPKPGASEYLVTAYPARAKNKSSLIKSTEVHSVWPEVVIGIVAAAGMTKWNFHPTLRSGLGWRKKPAGTNKTTRSQAAVALLEWWANENNNRKLNGG
jgi:hypothetical protein